MAIYFRTVLKIWAFVKSRQLQKVRSNPYVERIIGSIRRDCLDHLIILNAEHLKRMLTEYFEYYHHDRTHLGLGKVTPHGSPLDKRSENGRIVKHPRVGGLHRRYEWKEAA